MEDMGFLARATAPSLGFDRIPFLNNSAVAGNDTVGAIVRTQVEKAELPSLCSCLSRMAITT